MANAEIVAIGSELLLGQIVDTNSAWMAQRLTALALPSQIGRRSESKFHDFS